MKVAVCLRLEKQDRDELHRQAIERGISLQALLIQRLGLRQTTCYRRHKHKLLAEFCPNLAKSDSVDPE